MATHTKDKTIDKRILELTADGYSQRDIATQTTTSRKHVRTTQENAKKADNGNRARAFNPYEIHNPTAWLTGLEFQLLVGRAVIGAGDLEDAYEFSHKFNVSQCAYMDFKRELRVSTLNETIRVDQIFDAMVPGLNNATPPIGVIEIPLPYLKDVVGTMPITKLALRRIDVKLEIVSHKLEVSVYTSPNHVHTHGFHNVTPELSSVEPVSTNDADGRIATINTDALDRLSKLSKASTMLDNNRNVTLYLGPLPNSLMFSGGTQEHPFSGMIAGTA